ncbi:MAG: OmpA family protein [Alphaproteobacteria bacterium]
MERQLAVAFFLLPIAAFAADAAHDALRSKGGTVVDSAGECARTRWHESSDPCAPAAPTAPAPRLLQQDQRTLYFDFDKYTLTDETKRKLDTVASTLLADRDVKQARIVGYADPIGTPAYNEALSRKRAQAVLAYLTGRGYLNASATETRWLGENASRADCDKRLPRKKRIACLQPDRRVEIEIDYYSHRSP